MKKFSLMLIIVISVLLSGCGKTTDKMTVKDAYNGDKLTIGVIGELPKVIEGNVLFQQLQFDELKEMTENPGMDAIIITKENLEEASEGTYAAIYQASTIPVFFIQSEKSYVPFIREDLSYQDAAFMDDLTYITGIQYQDGSLKTWGFGLYNDTVSEENIQIAYTQLFETIDELKQAE